MWNTSNFEKVDGALDMSSWQNRCAPSLPDNAGLTIAGCRIVPKVGLQDGGIQHVREGPLIRALFEIRTTFKYRWVGGLHIMGHSNWTMKKSARPKKSIF